MILAADWIFPVSAPPLFRHALEITGDTITAIRPATENDPLFSNTVLIPGLVNAHTHLAYTALRNMFDDSSFFPWIRKLTEIRMQMTDRDLEASTLLGISECLRAGITTVADMSYSEPSLRLLASSPLRGIFYWEIFGVEMEQANDTWKELLTLFPRFQERYGSSRLQLGISPHSCYTVRPELFSRVAEWSSARNIPVSFHLSESKEEQEFVGNRAGIIHQFLTDRAKDWVIHGKTPVEHLQTTGIFETQPLLAHMVQVSENDLDILQQYNVSIAHCPKSNAKFGHGTAPLTNFLKRGFRTGIGSDSAASNNRIDLLEEGRFALLQQRALNRRIDISEEQILRLLTLSGSEALGLQDQIGSLEIGKKADIVAVSLPSYYSTAKQVLYHLIHNSGSSDVKATYIDGQVASSYFSEQDLLDFYRRLG